jgi:Holliday junction resolvase
MINSKQKGKRYELEVARYFRELGFDKARRSVQYNGQTEEGQADIVGVPFLHIECKHKEKLNIEEAMQQALRDKQASKKNRIPVVIHRKNGKKSKVTMTLDDFTKLYGEYYSSMVLAGMEDKE